MKYYTNILPALMAAGTIVHATIYTRSSTNSTTFGYDADTFYLHGQPVQMLGGQMDPQRIPREYWSDRLLKAKAMGLNTIFSYIYWNELETSPGEWDWNGIDGMNDIRAWYQEIQDAGLQAVIRPDPYVCGEREWGGFPAWLSLVPNITVRTNNPQFLTLSDYFLGNLSQQIQQYQVTKGGPILMAQVENEYGSFGDDHAYTAALSAIIAKHFDVIQYTNDGGSEQNIENGAIPGVLGEIDGPPDVGFTNREKCLQSSSQGPKLDGEYYINWLTTWGLSSTYPYVSGMGYNNSLSIAGLQYILDQGGSFSIYMFHGGTNFAFGNGGLNFGQLEPVTASYDYAAPLNESGRPREIYWQLRDFLALYHNESLPKYPETKPMLETDDIVLKPVAGLFDDLPTPTFSGWPLTMEQLGQARGYTLYRYTTPASSSYSGLLKVGDGPRDRVIVYINDTMQGVIDSVYMYPQNVTLSLGPGDVLSLLVENQGRVDFSTPLFDQRKGIVGDVYIGTDMVAPWSMYTLPVPTPPSHLNASTTNTTLTITNTTSPTWYTGTFSLPPEICGTAAADTYLTIAGGTKGVLYVNGINMGRYWAVGPQQSQYVPGVWLKEENEVVVLELEPKGQRELVARGSGEKLWFDRGDGDCFGCVSANPN